MTDISSCRFGRRFLLVLAHQPFHHRDLALVIGLMLNKMMKDPAQAAPQTFGVRPEFDHAVESTVRDSRKRFNSTLMDDIESVDTSLRIVAFQRKIAFR